MQTHRSKSQRASRKQARKYLPMCVCVFIVLIHRLNLVRYARRVYQSSSLTKPTSATYKGEMKAEWVTDIYQSCEDEYSCRESLTDSLTQSETNPHVKEASGKWSSKERRWMSSTTKVMTSTSPILTSDIRFQILTKYLGQASDDWTDPRYRSIGSN